VAALALSVVETHASPARRLPRFRFGVVSFDLNSAARAKPAFDEYHRWIVQRVAPDPRDGREGGTDRFSLEGLWR